MKDNNWILSKMYERNKTKVDFGQFKVADFGFIVENFLWSINVSTAVETIKSY